MANSINANLKRHFLCGNSPPVRDEKSSKKRRQIAYSSVHTDSVDRRCLPSTKSVRTLR